MDRRQFRTRELIFKAFISLLSKKNIKNITVGEIIEVADVGRATFYAHFETKDFLLKELCVELFDHIFDVDNQIANKKKNIFYCESTDSVFLHLFKHIEKNDNNISKLLSSQNNELFLEYFKSGVKKLVIKRINDFVDKKPKIVPIEFWINHITSTYIETLRWWIDNNKKETPERITEYFMQLV